jgi:hypothetical protein
MQPMQTVTRNHTSRRLVVCQAASRDNGPLRKGAAVLVGLGSALVIMQGGPGDARENNFLSKVEEQRRAFEDQAARLEYLLEQKQQASKASIRGKEEVCLRLQIFGSERVGLSPSHYAFKCGFQLVA